MPQENTGPIDLLDLKMLPAWVKQAPEPNPYAHYEGEAAEPRSDRGRPRVSSARQGDQIRRRPDGRDARRPASRPGRERTQPSGGDDNRRGLRHGNRHHPRPAQQQERPREETPLPVGIRFLPGAAAFDSVAAQIKAEALAYSVFSLARLFLQKPERYDVHVAGTPEHPLYQLGENGPVSADRTFLENNAFRSLQAEFYKIETTQNDPIKGNFTSVARHRMSGTVLGPTNYHDYQRKLRGFYEQRFSRRMSFADFQRQIEIVSDPALVEQWKEETRTVTRFTSLKDDPAQTFNSATEAEKHFKEHHLASVVGTIEHSTIDGLTSRTLADQRLRRAIETAWAAQTRSPSQMMAELANRLREAGLHIFRHRKGMLFVSPVRVRPFAHEQASVSGQVQAVVESISANPRVNRKDLAEKILAEVADEEMETRKLSLASDLKWLISEGYVIEFNDGSLDLPRSKARATEPQVAESTNGPGLTSVPTDPENPVASVAEAGQQRDAVARVEELPASSMPSSAAMAESEGSIPYAPARTSEVKPADRIAGERDDNHPREEEEAAEIGGS
jgi:hypothetical protein